MQISIDAIIERIRKFPVHDFEAVKEKRNRFLDIYGWDYSSGKPIPKHPLTKHFSTFAYRKVDSGLRDLLDLPRNAALPEDLKERWHISIGLMSALPDEILKQLPTEFEGAWVSYYVAGEAMALESRTLEDLERPLLEYFSKRLAGATS